MKTITLFCLSLLMLVAGRAQSSTSTPVSTAGPSVLSVERIWASGKHSAFTDLIRFDGQWYCTFRESEAHVGGDGQIRVLRSTDGGHWEPAALLSEAGIDLRDPKFSVTPEHQLMLVLGGSVYEGKKLIERQPRVAFSKNGRDWTPPQRILAKGDWLWRVTWHEGRAYGITYTLVAPPQAAASDTEWSIKLVASSDGIHFGPVADLAVPGRPNEATVRFLANGDCVALVRREALDKAAWIGVSHAPYTTWTWNPAGLQIGGPNFIVLPGGAIIAGGRQYSPAPTGPKLFLGRMDLQSVTPQVILPSGGDCSYPGLVWDNGVLWVSYYSTHEGGTNVYLAKLKL